MYGKQVRGLWGWSVELWGVVVYFWLFIWLFGFVFFLSLFQKQERERKSPNISLNIVEFCATSDFQVDPNTSLLQACRVVFNPLFIL